MEQPLVLPIITSAEHYRELFKNNANWDLAIRIISQKHLLNDNFSRSQTGSHIVYKAGPYWIKLMAPIYEKEMVFEIAGLKSVSGRLSVKTPEIVAQGIIEGWPYVILTDVPGVAIKDGWDKLQIPDQLRLVKSIAQTIHEIASCPADDIIKGRYNWNEFISDQYKNCEALQFKKEMPEPWLKQVKVFLAKFDINEFTTEHPVFLHCDLSYDHFLIELDQQPRLSGIIDMADAQWGHPEYELAAPCVFVLKGNMLGLKAFLTAAGYHQLNQKFSEKLLAWCLLHRYFFGFSLFFKTEMDACEAGNFSQLAQKVFPL